MKYNDLTLYRMTLSMLICARAAISRAKGNALFLFKESAKGDNHVASAEDRSQTA